MDPVLLEVPLEITDAFRGKVYMIRNSVVIATILNSLALFRMSCHAF